MKVEYRELIRIRKNGSNYTLRETYFWSIYSRTAILEQPWLHFRERLTLPTVLEIGHHKIRVI
jgi:hypothetical protein